MSDLDRQLADGLAAGRITEDDAQAVRDFARFLSEGVPSPKRVREGPPLTEDEKARYRAWLPYMTGQGDPPPPEAKETT